MIIYGFYEGTSLLSRIIRFETHSNISHVSIMVMRDSVFSYRTQSLNWPVFRMELESCALWEAWGKSGIIRRKGIREGHKPGTPIHLMRMKTQGLNAQIDQAAMIRYMDKCVEDGIKYDWIGLVRFMLRINRNSDSRMFCSEFAHLASIEGEQPLLQRVISPHFVAPADQYTTPILEPLCTIRT